MPVVRIDLRHPSQTGADAPVVRGATQWTPTRRRHVETGGLDYVVLPATVVGPAVGEITVAATGPGWCWRVLEAVTGGDPSPRYLAVPDVPGPLDYGDLAEVDPATLEPVTPPTDAWLEALGSVADGIPGAVADYLTANPPPAGDDGREVELQTSATHVQWRYDGDATWLDLIPLSIITGQDGSPGQDGSHGLSAELRTNATHIQWRQAGGAWADLIPLASLVGPAGPPNTLTIGTVTTLPAGSPATLSLTGEAPEQVLSAGIPMGLTGAASDWLKVGPGDPRTPATTAGQITGTEPNGCTYISTDGGGVGGYRWVKRAGVWVCVEGDTGPIDLTPKLNAGWTVSIATWQRINSVVYLRIEGAAGTVAGNIISYLPNWMRCTGGHVVWRQGTGGGTVIRYAPWYLNGQYIGGPPASGVESSLINGISPTSFAWPTTLTL